MATTPTAGWRMLLAGGEPELQESRRRRIMHTMRTTESTVLRVGRPVNEATPGIGDQYWRSQESLAWFRMEQTLLLTNFAAPLYCPGNVVGQAELQDLINQFITLMNHPVHSYRAIYKVDDSNVSLGLVAGKQCIQIDWKDTMRGFPPGPHPRVHQDGSVHRDTFTVYHGTRTPILRHIAQQGILQSSESHGQVGVWANKDLQAALVWNSNPLDLFAGCALALTAEQEDWCNNVRVRAGNPFRGVIKAPPGYMPRITIDCSFFLVPSPGQVDFREELRGMIQTTIVEALETGHSFTRLPDNDRRRTALECTVETLTLTEYRLSYISVVGALEDDFGGNLRLVSPVSIHISKAFACLIQAMHSASPQTKRKYLQRICPVMFPAGTRRWIEEKFSGISRFMTSPAPRDLGWHAFPKIAVRQWGHLAAGSDIDSNAAVQ